MDDRSMFASLASALAGRYEIDREIGRGGMATVYLARDVRHTRPVALKVLDSELGAVLGAERFLSEIRVTANLQHPNLLPLFDSGEADGLLFYVMPFVEGETLRHRLDRDKQLPIDDAVRIATAIAGALDYAHRHGVIHRDLKPENVLLHDGQPLVADFGIALAVSNAGGQRVTQTGLSLGTPQYMSPEQATGDRSIDGRTDIYSLGALTYEMLTGEPPHSGTTAQAIIARLMTEEPRPISSSRRSVPEEVEAAVLHALEKLPADRFQSAKEFADALHARGTTRVRGAAASAKNARKPWIAPPAAAIAAAVVAAAVGYLAHPTATVFPPARFTLDAPAGVIPAATGTAVALSPDGRQIVFSGVSTGALQLYSRALDDLEAKAIPGTASGGQPVYSPDGRWIAFLTTALELKKVEVTGGAAITLAKGLLATGMDWSSRGVIVIGSTMTHAGLSRLSEAGGEPVPLTKPDSAMERHYFPVVLADGRTILFTLSNGNSAQAPRLALTSLDDGIVHSLDVPALSALGVIDGYLVYLSGDGTIMAAPFDQRRRKVGGSVPLMEMVTGCAACAASRAVRLSRTGSLVALRGSLLDRLILIDAAGAEHQLSLGDADLQSPRFSPDGRRLAVSVRGSDSLHNRDIWIYDVATRSPTRLTSGKDDYFPRWTADGRRILFAAGDHRNPRQIWQQVADGSSPAARIDEVPDGMTADLSPDGRSVVFGVGDSGRNPVIMTTTIGSTTKPVVFADDKFARAPTFSPDGHWVVYESTETGRREIYVRPFPGPGGRVQVSVDGGGDARWIRGGRAIVYVTPDRTLSVASVTASPSFTVQSRSPFPTKMPSDFDGSNGFDVSDDGQHVAAVLPSGQGAKVMVILNFAQELREKLKR
jgi:eukaryotic-like serine/threonine-protein kinase